MRLVRYYVNAAFTYLANHLWDAELLAPYVKLMEAIPLSTVNVKVSDGLRYHVLDVWVEELDSVDEGRGGVCPMEEILGPVRRLEREGRTKKVRERAKECLKDERLRDWSNGSGKYEADEDRGLDHGSGNDDGSCNDDEADEWGGLEN